MIGRILTVSGFTLLSRVTGFLRDIVLAWVLGAGPVADAFFVALRLPNHFRAIFAEGAFNAAFVPTYAQLRTSGSASLEMFASRIFTLLLVVQLLLLAIALLCMPWVITLLAPGFARESGQFALAVALTRITFPYLLLITLVTLYSGILNAIGRFAAAAAAPILLNLSIVFALFVAAAFPSPGHAAAWGVFAAGVLEALLVGGDAWRQGALPRLRWPRFDSDVKTFLKRFAPATVGSAETQIALFADTIIASFLVAGSLSALYYADRLNQLPIGVIAVAVGTVLLPEMANRLAANDEQGARHAQNRAIEFTLLLSIPCFAAFFFVPETIMRGLFERGAFTATDTAATAATLRAYATGLFAFVLIRSMAITYLSRGDTWTPVVALSYAVAVNVALKVLLFSFTNLAQVGLALATSAGAWVNVILLYAFARRADLISFDEMLRQSAVRLGIAGVALIAVLMAGEAALATLFAERPHRGALMLTALAILGGLVYGVLVLALFGKQRIVGLFRRPRPPATQAPALPDEP
ncbi:MAG TPA: murein biosynthesis integral membrane protein MurJ [Xanthobacteraceae bacterium]|nr:murein biosynthesis integral membrane protein MurJ [Xanthobacteraceae bacterium]